MEKVKVGVIGCGAISGAYLKQCAQFEILDLVACSDLVLEKAQARAKEFNVPIACAPEELLANEEIELVVNLTVPQAHFEVSQRALLAGKSVWSEKPLALERAYGRQLVELAEEKGVLLGCAPDTFLGGGHQLARKLVDEGAIGQPVAAVAFMMCPGHESWHPNPAFYYKPGGGPMFDMGPYYLTDLVQLLGPARRATGSTSMVRSERLITSEPLKGTRIKVEVPTHVAGLIDFANGAISTIITSFDVHAASLPFIELYGTEGSLSVPDPNGPGGVVKLFKPGKGWREVPQTFGLTNLARSTGVADMAYALREGRKPRANGELALHVLDLMQAFHEASREGKHIDLVTTCERPEPLPEKLKPGTLEAL